MSATENALICVGMNQRSAPAMRTTSIDGVMTARLIRLFLPELHRLGALLAVRAAAHRHRDDRVDLREARADVLEVGAPLLVGGIGRTVKRDVHARAEGVRERLHPYSVSRHSGNAMGRSFY